ncbi:plasma kallikrein-like [Dunckerocampus dactyliophorus]|uniref:plasma kallikrein-like n=1 Tax=Dunckerocampus dactyliophorus TaxID=161453 RepID=UPI002406D3A7|nr:plasma kallikrein-like [Dunckerocampus dactyliophorus]
MALGRLLCGLTLFIVTFFNGCHAQLQNCGQAALNTRIIGGQDASPGFWPWQVSLNKVDFAFCGGSLISHQWVLTAAHCVGQEDILDTFVYVGRQSQSGPNPNEVVREMEAVMCHPDYNNRTFENDICLVKLSSPVNFTHYAQPICLADEGSTAHTGTSSWITGWGTTSVDDPTHPDILQEANLPIVGNKECECYLDITITDNFLCAGLKEGGKDSCQGDSGGPLMSKNNLSWVLLGITSFGFSCARPKSPGVYTRVSKYKEWIVNTIANVNDTPIFDLFTSPGVDRDTNFTCTSPTDDSSVFGGGGSVARVSAFSCFIMLCVTVWSMYVLAAVVNV